MKYFFLLFFSTFLYSADSGFYIELNYDNQSSDTIKTLTTNVDYDKGVAGSVAVGYQMDRWRFEAESNYAENPISKIDDTLKDTKSGNLLKFGGLANIYYSAYNDTKLVSTLGLGVGATSIDNTKDDKKTSLTYQGSVSLGYMVDEDWTWTVKYRHLEMKDIESKQDGFSLGLRYLF